VKQLTERATHLAQQLKERSQRCVELEGAAAAAAAEVSEMRKCVEEAKTLQGVAEAERETVRRQKEAALQQVRFSTLCRVRCAEYVAVVCVEYVVQSTLYRVLCAEYVVQSTLQYVAVVCVEYVVQITLCRAFI